MKVGGRDFDLTREEVEQKMRPADPESLHKYAINVNGLNYPPKQVLATVTGWDRSTFTTMEAQRVLRKLGFESFSITVMRTGRREFVPDSGRQSDELAELDAVLLRLSAVEAALGTAHEAIAGLSARVRTLEAAN